MPRTYDCLHCPVISATATDHMVHVHEAHADRVGLGRANGSRRGFSCRACAVDLPADATACRCGWIVPAGSTAATS